METVTEEIPEDDGLAAPSSPINIMSDLVSLDSNGDAILAIGDPDNDQTARFLISTKVLSLASPVFAKMFGPNFLEGHKIRSGETVQVKLPDDDALAMEIILKALHFYKINGSHSVAAEELASISVHCDKYDCTSALSPWIYYWFSNLKPVTRPPTELGYLLLASYIFDDAEHFIEISARALRDLTISFPLDWESHEILNLLPDNLQGIITTKIKQILRQLHIIVQSVEITLRRNKTSYRMQDQVCMTCGRTLPNEAKQCRPCGNTTLCPNYCTAESRVVEYFAILEKEKLWPSVTPFEVCSVSDLALRLTSVKDNAKHSCAAGSKCPLNYELTCLCDSVRQFEEGVTGLCLHCVKTGNWDKSQACTCE